MVGYHLEIFLTTPKWVRDPEYDYGYAMPKFEQMRTNVLSSLSHIQGVTQVNAPLIHRPWEIYMDITPHITANITAPDEKAMQARLEAIRSIPGIVNVSVRGFPDPS